MDATPDSSTGRSAFMPLVLLALSVIILFVWNLQATAQIRSEAKLLRDQQVKMVEQSRQAQAALEKLARDLIDVASSDDNAKAIVTKYQITVNGSDPAPSKGKP